MALTKSEQSILDAFAWQRERRNANPSFTAVKVIRRSGTTGKRQFQAAESLVQKGLARVIRRESDQIRGRGGVATELILTVGPPAQESREQAKAPKKGRPAKAIRSRRRKSKSASSPDWPTILRDYLTSSAPSDSELARATGMPQPTITRFRNGTRSLSFANAAILAAHLGFTFLPPK